MAMTVDVDDDRWPSLAPIRTSATPACLPGACDTICKSSNLQQEGCTLQAYGHGAACICSCASVSSKSRGPDVTTSSCILPSNTHDPLDLCSLSQPDCSSKASDTDLVRRSSCCSKKTCFDLFSCFSCTKPTSSPCPQRRCTPTCMQKNGPVLRSMAFLFPSAGFQSFYSSPTGKAAQLSGAFPRALSAGKLQHYTSPRTPGNHPISGKIQYFSSPRTPGSANLQCLSAPRTPASGKVQHFSGAIPSPRTPFGSGAASPSSARRRKSSFTLFMPPNATADKKKAADHLAEPTSPHVTCIGRVRRQTHCNKPHHKDIINPHDTVAKKKGAYSKKTHSESGLSTRHSISSNEAPMKSITELSTMEDCRQNFGRNQLHNLHKIHGFGDECDNANNPDQVAPDCNQGDDIIPIANGNVLMHLGSQNHGRHCFLSNLECIDGNMRSLQEADHGMSENIRMHTITDGNAEFTEYDKVELLVDTPAALHTICSQNPHDLQQEAHDESQCLESLSQLQHEAHKSQCQNPGLQLNTSTTAKSIDHCLLLIRGKSSRKLSDFDRSI